MAAAAHIAAVALRNRVAEDLTAQTAVLEQLRRELAVAERVTPNALDAYLSEGPATAAALQDQVNRQVDKVARVKAALVAADRRVADEARIATEAYIREQRPALAKIRAKFLRGAKDLSEAFDDLTRWESDAERAGADRVMTLDVSQKTAINSPRCGHHEFAAHLRTQV